MQLPQTACLALSHAVLAPLPRVSALLLVVAALAQRMQLPQTACLALSGPLEVPETGGGRAWFTAFDDEWELIQVGVCTHACVCIRVVA
jgi:hypothetical protein